LCHFLKLEDSDGHHKGGGLSAAPEFSFLQDRKSSVGNSGTKGKAEKLTKRKQSAVQNFWTLEKPRKGLLEIA
jgi:hypothetical protein